MSMQISLFFIARVCLALYFIIGAMIDSKMRQETLQMMRAKKIPLAQFLFVCAVALKLIAGFGVMLNIFSIISALTLAIFTLIANVIFNNFWIEVGMKKTFSAVRFLANLAVVGGLLLLVAYYL